MTDVYLEVQSGPQAGEQIPLSGSVTLGRAADNDIPLRDLQASRHHARIDPSSDGHVIEDTGSVNGTFVNGRRIDRAELKDGDRVEIGETTMVFKGAAPSPSAQDLRDDVDVSFVTHEARSAPRQQVDASIVFDEGAAIDAGSSTDLLSISKRLAVMNEVSRAIGGTLDLDEVLKRIMDNLFKVFPQAERGFVLLKDETSDHVLRPRIVRRRHATDKAAITVSRTILREAMQKRQSILTEDATEDDRFDGAMSVMQFDIRSMMCSPLICRGEVLGAIHIDTNNRRNPFGENDLTLLTGIAAQAAVSVKNARLRLQVEQEAEMRASLQRYLSPRIVQEIMEKKVGLDLPGKEVTGTVLFSDIVGFTAMSERMAPETVVSLLNRYFETMVEILFDEEATIDKFGGDAIMAVWNVPLVIPHAELRAIRAALRMQNAIGAFNAESVALEAPAVGMGIGVNTGSFVAGNIGSSQQMEYTVIGDSVNLASRIEALATRGQVLVNETTYAAAKAVAGVRLPAVPVKGKSRPIVTYAVRAVEEREGRMVTSIPLRIADDETALIVAVEGEQIEVASSREPPEGKVPIDAVLPEWPEPLAATAEFGERIDAPEGLHAARARLVAAADDLAALLRPGGLLQSETPPGQRA